MSTLASQKTPMQEVLMLVTSFRAYCGFNKTDLDGRVFVRLCNNWCLLDVHLTSEHVGIIFAKVEGKRQV